MAYVANNNSKRPAKLPGFEILYDLEKPQILAFHLGWEDVRQGRRFDKSYDRLARHLQLSYENGRNAASHMIGKFGKAPVPITNAELGQILGPRLNASGWQNDMDLLRETKEKLVERMKRQEVLREFLAEVGEPLDVEVY